MVELAGIVLAGLALAILAHQPAGSAQFGSHRRSIRPGDVLGLGYFFSIVALGLVASAVYDVRIAGRRARVAAFGFAAIGILTTVWIVLAEGLARILPTGALPEFIRRHGPGLAASTSAWLVVLAAAIGTLSATALLQPMARRAWSPDLAGPHLITRIASLLTLAVGVTLVGFGRVVPVATVTIPDQRADLEPWAISYLGPGLLLAVYVMGILGALCALRIGGAAVGLAGAATAWVVASVAALMHGISAFAADTTLIRWAVESVGLPKLDVIDVQRGDAALLLFVGAVIAGLGFALHVAGPGSRHG